MATGTITLVDTGGAGRVRKLKWTCIADGSGNLTSDPSDPITGLVIGLETDPGTSAAPTDNYDLTVTNTQGTDVLNGAGADRDATANEWAFPTFNGVPVMIPLRETRLTLNGANLGNGGSTVVTLFILQP